MIQLLRSSLILFVLLIGSILCIQLEYHSPNVIILRDSNLSEVQSLYNQITVLFHNSACAHSNKYLTMYQQYCKSTAQIQERTCAVADCASDKNLCQKFNITGFPSVLKVSSQKAEQIDEYDFLGASLSAQSEQAYTKKVIELLENPPYYIIAVLQEVGFPIEQRLEHQRILYLQPSLLYHTLLNYTNKRTGCWILQYNKTTASLAKYSCGSGVEPQLIQTALTAYKNGALQEYKIKQYPRPPNPTYLYGEALAYEELVDESKLKQPHLILIEASGWCPACRDVGKTLSSVLYDMDNEKLKIRYFVYNADKNEIPSNKIVLKLPFLQLTHHNVSYVYGGRTEESDLRDWILQILKKEPSKKTQVPEASPQQQQL